MILSPVTKNRDSPAFFRKILVLVDIFRKTAEEASEIMLAVHRNGMGVCGVYPREIAEFRVREVEKRARLAGFPLRCTMEEES